MKTKKPGPEPDSRAPRDGDETRESDSPCKEIGGRDGPDPTRYGDWEKAGRCIDF
ncbi:MAG: DUF1674 domain-containing protein [Gammaproteobacteria bacterium]